MDAKDGKDPSPLSVSADRIRETAKWLTVSLAVLGGVLTAGTQLSGIGRLQPGSERFDLAANAAGAAILGTVLILFGTVWTATSPPVTLMKLKPKSYLDDPALLQGFGSMEVLRRQYLDALAIRKNATDEDLNAPTRDTRRKAAIADIRLAYLDGIMHNVLKTAAYHRVATRWRVAVVLISVGALIAAAGVVAFVWAINPPPDLEKSAASPVLVGEVTETSLHLTAEGRAALAKGLGDGCPVSEPLKVMLLNNSATGADVVVSHPGCRKIRILVTPSWGIVDKGGALPTASPRSAAGPAYYPDRSLLSPCG